MLADRTLHARKGALRMMPPGISCEQVSDQAVQSQAVTLIHQGQLECS
jgi:hypothetical protein